LAAEGDGAGAGAGTSMLSGEVPLQPARKSMAKSDGRPDCGESERNMTPHFLVVVRVSGGA
jgi:hypothetical protein